MTSDNLTRTASGSDVTSAHESIEHKLYQNRGNPRVLANVPQGVTSVLDLGCGAGDNAAILADRGIAVDGITLSREEMAAAQPHCRNLFIHNLETGLPTALENRYDTVLASHVLEHICYPKSLLADIKKVLTPDGRLVVALPNLMWWKTRLRLLRGRFDYDESGIMDYTHFRWYTFQTAQQLLVDNGFVVESANAYGCFPLGPIRRILPQSIVESLDRRVSKLLPGLFGYEMIFVAKVAP